MYVGVCMCVVTGLCVGVYATRDCCVCVCVYDTDLQGCLKEAGMV